MIATNPLRLIVYGREGCHLCEDMWHTLLDFQKQDGFALEWVDVDDSAELARDFGARVPVLMAGGRELCHYFLDVAALKSLFQ